MRSAGWADLVHADAAHVLSLAGVPSLVLKGPSFAAAWYADHTRDYADADVLVPAQLLPQALDALHRRGYRTQDMDLRPDERPAHALTLRRPGSGSDLDLHVALPGARAAATDQWTALWQHREVGLVASRPLWWLDPPGRLLHAVLHAAVNGQHSQRSTEDLQRCLATVDEDVWPFVVVLARDLDCLHRLAAGLLMHPDGADLIARHLPAEVPVDLLSALRSTTGSGPASRAAEILALPRDRRLRLLLSELVPSRAFMERHHPLAFRGRAGLLMAHLQRQGRLLSGLPALARALRQARRRTTQRPEGGST